MHRERARRILPMAKTAGQKGVSPAATEPRRSAGAFLFFSSLRLFREWRAPDSNRRHHDSQSGLRRPRLSAVVHLCRLCKPDSSILRPPVLTIVSSCVGVVVGVHQVPTSIRFLSTLSGLSPEHPAVLVQEREVCFVSEVGHVNIRRGENVYVRFRPGFGGRCDPQRRIRCRPISP